MADIQTSEMEAKLASVNVEVIKVKTGNNGNHIIFVWHLNP
jgi:hypothetical protein